MEESKVQALHDSLSQLRGHQGLGSRSRYSWQTNKEASQDEEEDEGLPPNALYAYFHREGRYDPSSGRRNDGDGRLIKRDFSDIDPDDSSAEKRARKELRKAEKKAARKAEKLEAKRQAKLQEKREAKRIKRRASCMSEATGTTSVVQSEVTVDTEACEKRKVKKRKKDRKSKADSTSGQQVETSVSKLQPEVGQSAGESSSPTGQTLRKRKKANKKK